MKKKTCGIYAGSFDILTLGHWDVILKSRLIFDKLIVAIGHNPAKKTLFTDVERKEIIESSVRDYLSPCDVAGSVEADIFTDEFLMDYARRMNADFIVRGLRDSEDFRQEQNYKFFNKRICDLNGSKIETIYLMPEPEYANISSSAVKSMIGPKGWKELIRPYVTFASYKKIIEKYQDS